MSDRATEDSGEELIDDEGRNATQRRLDDEVRQDAPVDVGWEANPRDAEEPRDEGRATGG